MFFSTSSSFNFTSLCSFLHPPLTKSVDPRYQADDVSAEFSSKNQPLLNQGHFVFTSAERQSEETFISWTGNLNINIGKLLNCTMIYVIFYWLLWIIVKQE